MASLQHDAVPRCGKDLSTSSCLVFVHCKTAKGKDRRWGCGDCRRPEVLSRATSPRGSPKCSFPNADASRHDPALEFGFLNNSASLLRDIDRVASLYCYPVF
jgi:hypothetical protein